MKAKHVLLYGDTDESVFATPETVHHSHLDLFSQAKKYRFILFEYEYTWIRGNESSLAQRYKDMPPRVWGLSGLGRKLKPRLRVESAGRRHVDLNLGPREHVRECGWRHAVREKGVDLRHMA